MNGHQGSACFSRPGTTFGTELTITVRARLAHSFAAVPGAGPHTPSRAALSILTNTLALPSDCRLSCGGRFRRRIISPPGGSPRYRGLRLGPELDHLGEEHLSSDCWPAPSPRCNPTVVLTALRKPSRPRWRPNNSLVPTRLPPQGERALASHRSGHRVEAVPATPRGTVRGR